MTDLQCPVCSSGLRPTHREGVEIDVCPKCRGVWLDRGELEKLSGVLGRDEPRDRKHQTSGRFGFGDDDDDDSHYRGRSGQPERKRSFLDFFD